MTDLVWTTYVPRRVYRTARRLEEACENAEDKPSPIGEAEWRMTTWPTQSGRDLWAEVWRFLMGEYCRQVDENIRVVIVDDPGFDRVISVSPRQIH